jgi:hypothetical protein
MVSCYKKGGGGGGGGGFFFFDCVKLKVIKFAIVFEKKSFPSLQVFCPASLLFSKH